MQLIFKWTKKQDRMLYQNQIVYQWTLPDSHPDCIIEQLLLFRVKEFNKLPQIIYVHDVFDHVPTQEHLAQAVRHLRETIEKEEQILNNLFSNKKINNKWATATTGGSKYVDHVGWYNRPNS